jgi:hypothetical protein
MIVDALPLVSLIPGQKFKYPFCGVVMKFERFSAACNVVIFKVENQSGVFKYKTDNFIIKNASIYDVLLMK